MIYVIGMGPGGKDEITPRALSALERCDVILGYKAYTELLLSGFDGFAEKDVRPSAMRHEAERCRDALALSKDGRTVALISSGDPGVYGMAGLMLEISDGQAEIEIIPGVTAATSAAAILGAPLMGDFAVVSLSDILTPKELIERRLEAAAKADFALCLYNPSSRGRPHHFQWACDVLLKHKSPDTPAGWVSNIGRNGEKYFITTLGEIRGAELDMFCTAIIGNSMSVIKDGRIITRRGYR